MQTRYILILLGLFAIGACDTGGQEGDACADNTECAEGLECHKEHDHDHDHEGEQASAEEGEEHGDEAGVCEPKGEDGHEGHDHE